MKTINDTSLYVSLEGFRQPSYRYGCQLRFQRGPDETRIDLSFDELEDLVYLIKSAKRERKDKRRK